MDFDLWLEFEHAEDGIDDVCNVAVELVDGRRYALSVWTFGFFYVARLEDEGSSQSGPSDVRSEYMLPPDLFVRELTRPLIESVIRQLLADGTMPEHCRAEIDDSPASQ